MSELEEQFLFRENVVRILILDIQSKLATSEVTFAAIFRPNFAVSELEKILLSSDDVDEFCNYKLESSDIFFRT